jgi:IS5 family transposase
VPLPDDSEAIAQWRQRMGTEAAKEIYKQRAATAGVNAIARGRGLSQFLVRGLEKVTAVALWYALAHNLMRGVTLTQPA